LFIESAVLYIEPVNRTRRFAAAPGVTFRVSVRKVLSSATVYRLE
jgi:hypothetical protein